MLNKLSTIGIWGLGIVGKSAVRFFSKKKNSIVVYDQKQLSLSDLEFLSLHNARFHTGTVEEFLAGCDAVLPSPGIDLRPYAAFNKIFINELDIFASEYHKAIIAITGSVGKTTVTHLLSHLLVQSGARVITGGNIGTGMLDLLDHPDASSSDYCVLELSSFQLELCKTFAPHLALWTNFFPNHLDRHGTLHQYFLAKCNILRHQTSTDHALVPLALAQELCAQYGTRSFNYFSATVPTQQEIAQLTKQDTVFYLDNNAIMKLHNDCVMDIGNTTHFSSLTFAANWLTLYAACHILGITTSFDRITTITLPSHRLEKTATVHGVDFYDDSKATIPESTIAAIQQLSRKPIVLFLGGISKGVDRSTLIKHMPLSVKHVICFGREAEQLFAWCKEYGFSASVHSSLEEGFTTCLQYVAPGDQVLFSPAGASYDLFNNYQERGTQFKKLVQQHGA
ncbi:UDP-N-acetylmuramoylalanine--D-glutamate ligase [Candidatus Dependentiae bacterium Noda2021]|nr:UDP-N-acetylmuramoylalanine--D-glutamate ligase [Candidatus Dependentiae bacterium Noda2021]